MKNLENDKKICKIMKEHSSYLKNFKMKYLENDK